MSDTRQPDPERECYRKRRYGDEHHARQVAAKVWHDRHVPLSWYPCLICGGWHLTKRRLSDSNRNGGRT